MEMIGHDDERMQQKATLIAVLKQRLLQQLRIRRNLEQPAALRGYASDEIRADFLRSESHAASIQQGPVAKATLLSKRLLRGLKAPAPSR